MTKPEFKPGHLCINHPGQNVESFAVGDGAAYMFFDENGIQKLAIEDGTDWVDFDDSELIGGSETLVRVWGIPISEAEVEDGATQSLTPDVSSMEPDGDRVSAWFFATVGHRVGSIAIEFPGKMRVRLALHIDDITEETEECNTIITLDTVLTKRTELERPA